MINVSIDRYWNNGLSILDQEPGTYSLLFGACSSGPALVPVFAKTAEYVNEVFSDGQLVNEYKDYKANGGGQIWLVRTNGTHYQYNIGGCFSITTLSAIEESDVFYYRVWRDGDDQYLSINILDRQLVYHITGYRLKDVIQLITTDGVINGTGVIAQELDLSQPLLDYDSVEDDKIELIKGAEAFTDEFIEVYDSYIADIISNSAADVVGITSTSFDLSRTTRWELIRKFSESLIENSNGFVNTMPSLGVLPYVGTVESLIDVSNSFYLQLKQNPASLNTHSETFSFTTGEPKTNLMFSPIQEYTLFLINGEGERIEYDFTGVCTIDSKYGIIEITDGNILPATIEIEYTVERFDIHKLLCITFNPVYSNEEYVSCGVGSLMGKAIGSGINGSIRFNDINYQSSGLLEEVDDAFHPVLKRNGIIFTYPIIIGGSTYRNYSLDKTIYSILEPDSLLCEICNSNLIRKICYNISNLMELAFSTGKISQIELVMEKAMEPFSGIINKYEFRFGQTYAASMQLEYFIEIDVYVDGKVETIGLGYAL